MSVEDRLYARLSGFAGLTALIGTRVYPLRMPQNPTLPAITYQRVTTDHAHAMASTAPVKQSSFQFSVWSTKYLDLNTVVVQLRAALNRWKDTAGTPKIYDTMPESETDLFEPGADVFHRALDFTVVHDE